MRRSLASRPEGVATRRLNELAETLDIMLPELTVRIAAVEHLLAAEPILIRTSAASSCLS
ncbi:MAG: hypothetical protein AUI21_04810 [Nitrospirae bacterium 13_1_40CM_2_62_10]|nr:MAG: hypothetical protein AUI21_04810 [Nitrospirae bacterium 13_1_40CM_2_62_10]